MIARRKLDGTWVNCVGDRISGSRKRKTVSAIPKQKIRVTCNTCKPPTVAEVDVTKVSGWKLVHQREKHFGHPWDFSVAKKA